MNKFLKMTFFLSVLLLCASSCKKSFVKDTELAGTSWLEDGGTKTFEFAKNDVLVNGVSLCISKKSKIYVENGQIWRVEGDVTTYLYDYKLSGNNLFIAAEATNQFFDPSSPSYLGVKYRPN